ncbi:DarT ssDNA thymidine ADP-ribosyltransferase family protein [Kistimonas asteriae]|uniref:DarT ssDNA thymidine ADP-ribosyltransferase family protein n=1 Tax=Kistimonas asteriae TaxID=517724 RepID=UPI001BA74E5A|nr:DarT ssDNA thymidine ADP-ribosyltransferase family protein [Kistimonas asteriae]
MPSIRDQKLLYHLTCRDNLGSILESGLLPRNSLPSGGFDDIADPEIICSRSRMELADYVPFHFFARNPFDGNVQTSSSNTGKRFILIAVRRDMAQANGWKIIPRHPLAFPEPKIMDYDDGMNTIDWDAMEKRDYQEAHSKSVCMAECLSPSVVPVEKFFSIYVKDENDQEYVQQFKDMRKAAFHININAGMFNTSET